MMARAQTKLEVNRDLINDNFDSYRYNRDAKYSVFAKCLPNGGKLHSFKLSNSDYSLCHVSMSSSINNLYHNQFDPSKVYLITDGGVVLTAYPVKTEDSSVQFELKPVFTIPGDTIANKRGLCLMIYIVDFNNETMHASLSFPSQEYALVLLSLRYSRKVTIQKPNEEMEHLERNGHRVKLFILKRTLIDQSEIWDNEFNLDIAPKCLYSKLNFIDASHLHLFDSTLSSDDILRIIIGSVQECFQVDPKIRDRLVSRFGAIFHQIQLQRTDADNSTKWIVTANKRFIEDARVSNDFPKYVSLGNEDDIVIVSNFRMKYNSIDSSLLEQMSCENDFDGEIILTVEELNDQPIDDETLIKVEREETEAIMKAEFTKAVFDEYENCDLGDSDSSLVMTRFDSQGNVLNEFDLSAQQWLFSMVNYSTHNRFPYFVTRHNVDAFIYEPQSSLSNLAGDDHPVNGNFYVKHLDSFPAFGYVHASKQNRRFVTFCQKVSPSKTEFNNAIIDNWIDQLLYVYCKPSSDPTADNKKSSNGQQFLFHFGQNSLMKTTNSSRAIINGLYALPNFDGSTKHLPKHDWTGAIFLLTDDTLCLVNF